MSSPVRLRRARAATPADRARARFLHFFPDGFGDETYVAWERGYKEAAHRQWIELLGQAELRRLNRAREYREVGQRAVRIEARTNLLFSFEKMAIRDALRSDLGARAFALGLEELLHGDPPLPERFDRWIQVVGNLPRRQTRVLTWPVATVFPFLAEPRIHLFVKPRVTRRAAAAYGFPFEYESRPSWRAYERALAFAERIREDQAELGPRDLIDVQGFIWVMGSDEYD